MAKNSIKAVFLRDLADQMGYPVEEQSILNFVLAVSKILLVFTNG